MNNIVLFIGSKAQTVQNEDGGINEDGRANLNKLSCPVFVSVRLLNLVHVTLI
jgi:hypothetical protein